MWTEQDIINKGLKANTPKTKPSKFRNVRCEYNGIKFQSKLEMNHYIRLLNDPNIKKIECQVRFDFVVNGVKLKTFYKADFRVTFINGVVSIIDSKGRETSDFKIKKQLMKACHNIDVELWTK